MFLCQLHLKDFVNYMNTTHPNIKFTLEFEENYSFSFLEFKITRYYLENRGVLKEKARNKYRNLWEEKEAKREYGQNRHRNMKENKLPQKR